MSASWRPSLGAWPDGDATRFRVWAPERERVELVLETPGRPASSPLARSADGFFEGRLAGVRAGDRYRYRLDGEGPFPDPASRFQPEGVHGASEVVDPAFEWSDAGWTGVPREELVVYELHVGTFTAEGTFASAAERLPDLATLGVTAVELMPLADFPGARNWGYDGACLFAPARCYGRPDDLRRLVDRAHGLGLAVFIDVVYNHFGPDGAYAGAFSRRYFSSQHSTPWGAAMNLDGEGSEAVRAFFIENTLHWIHEYHLDGLRLDATHALVDDSPRHFLAELQARVRESAPGRRRAIVCEDHRNLASILRPEAEGGFGIDAVWSDDFHHEVRRAVAGDHEGYYRDFSGALADVAATVRDGWFFKGQHSEHFEGPRGTDTAGLDPRRFVFFVQNHDQVGNRALGERLHHQVDLPVWRAASALLLLSPETPLLFMGQEWAAPEPFQFFTDHNPELGRLVTEGRRKEFRHFSAFSDAAARERIPDPQAEATFRRSRLDWSRREQPPHASTLRLYRELLRLRRTEPLLRDPSWDGLSVRALGEEGLVLARLGGENALVALVRLSGEGRLAAEEAVPALREGASWALALSTEDEAFAHDPRPPSVDLAGAAATFLRPGAVVLRGRFDPARSGR
ncbi:MAG TPA: malto-oligosyltrehalose trehalohydrolase [Vicinamibacteria bacterium]|nr:malto-oligosyltrehalose trehalohydrolase [Vicinamibacteria bacterium]